MKLIVAVGVVGVAMLVSVLWMDNNMPLELPPPTGSYAVGRISAAWVDANRQEPFGPRPAPRELVVWMWYPAQRDRQVPPAEYMPESWQRASADHAGAILTQFLSHNPAKVTGHSLTEPGLSPDRASYPLVIFRSGIGALALQYATVAEDLASHGYIVVGADAPYSTSVVVMPDGRVIQKATAGNPEDAPISPEEQARLLQALIAVWSADTAFLLDQITRLNAMDPSGRFTGRIDLARVGVAGHSFGGATAAEFCHDDRRCRAGIDLDGAPYGRVVKDGVSQPFLFLVSDHGQEWLSARCDICANIRSAASREPGSKLIVTLEGADHFSFSDMALTHSRILRSVRGMATGRGSLDARSGLISTTIYVRKFFDVHLGGAPRDELYAAPLVAGARFEAK